MDRSQAGSGGDGACSRAVGLCAAHTGPSWFQRTQSVRTIGDCVSPDFLLSSSLSHGSLSLCASKCRETLVLCDQSSPGNANALNALDGHARSSPAVEHIRTHARAHARTLASSPFLVGYPPPPPLAASPPVCPSSPGARSLSAQRPGSPPAAIGRQRGSGCRCSPF